MVKAISLGDMGITILTLIPVNVLSDQIASDFDGVTKLKGRNYCSGTGHSGRITTEATYKARGGN